MPVSPSSRTVYCSAQASALAPYSAGSTRYASFDRFCSPTMCQKIMVKNITKPQRKAIVIHTISIRCSGSFHHRRFSGGVSAIACRLLLLGDGDEDDVHQPPQQVENSWTGNADEQKQERVVRDALHQRDAFGVVNFRSVRRRCT